jgi:hypothetical protein
MASDNENEQIYNFDSHSTDDDLYRSKLIDNDEEAEPTNELVNIDSIEHAKLIGDYLGLCDKLSNLPMNRLGYLNFIAAKKRFKALDKKQQILARDPQIHHPSIKQLKELDDLFDKVSDILDDDELEAKLTKFKDSNPPAPVPTPAPVAPVPVVPAPVPVAPVPVVPAPVPVAPAPAPAPAPVAPAPAPAPAPVAPAPVVSAPTYYDPFKACITIKPKEEPKSSSYYDPHTAPITTKKKAPEQLDNEKLLEEYYNEKQLKEAEWTKVKTLTKQLKDMKKQMEDYNKYKMFYIKNNGTDTAETTNDRLKLFISSNYEITTNHKDRIKTSTIYKEYSTISQMDIKIFISKCKDLGMEVIKASGYNVFTCIKAKTAI